MCGIAGITGYNKPKASELMQSMLKLQHHRGPDATGMWQDDYCTLGHNRLSIIDTDASANQPMQSHCGRYIMVYNGELYNYKELKIRLKNRNWKTRSDTEVLLETWAHSGKDCLNSLNGMFAFAVWDTHTRRLFLCRDRLGIKPLYYSNTRGFMAFASELRTLLHSGMTSSTLNLQAITQFLHHQWIQSPDTLMADIRQLPAGYYAEWTEHEFAIHQWWNLYSFSATDQHDKQSILGNIKDLFLASVERRLISDVPLGAFLSGGIDSSAVVAAMAACSTQQVNTFSIGFNEKEWDESTFAAMVAKKYNTHHHTLTYSGEELLQDIPEILTSFDTPSTDGVNTWVISRKVKEAGITVALSGLGGDELFGGYPVFNQLPKLLDKRWLWQLPLHRTAGRILSHTGTLASQKAGRMLLENPLKEKLYPYFREIQPPSAIDNLLVNKEKIASATLLSYPADPSIINWISKTEISGYTRHVLLKDADMCSMHHALEIRVPFFDYTLVEYMLQVPDDIKKPVTPKKLFVEAMDDLLPDSVVNRPKMGFAFPWDRWIRGPLRPFAEKNLVASANYPIFNKEAVMFMWKEFLAGKGTVKWYRIWNMVCLIHWMETNLKKT